MAFVQNYGFPYYYTSPPPPPHSPILPPPYHPHLSPPPPPAAIPPSHPTLPPPPAAKPPSHPTLPPPPAAKPPSHPTLPPPPSPPAIPPPPSPGHHTTIIVVLVSLGGLFLLGFLAVALCCFLKKRKRKEIQEMEVVKVDEHLRIQEAVVPGPHGAQTVILSIDEDIHVEEEMKKMKKNDIVSQGSQSYHPGQIIQQNDHQKT